MKPLTLDSAFAGLGIASLGGNQVAYLEQAKSAAALLAADAAEAAARDMAVRMRAAVNGSAILAIGGSN